MLSYLSAQSEPDLAYDGAASGFRRELGSGAEAGAIRSRLSRLRFSAGERHCAAAYRAYLKVNGSAYCRPKANCPDRAGMETGR